MYGFDSARLCLPALLAALITLAGCAEGPMPYLLSLNPKMRQEWAADEMYQPTLHRQLAEVAALRDAAGELSIDQQRHWSGEMTHILEHHDNPLLRAAAVEPLAEFDIPEADEGLRIALSDKDAAVRETACEAWAERGNRESLQRLSETLGSDTDLDVRIAAARELGRFSDPVAYEALGLALQETDPALRHQALESLRRASGKDYGHDVEAWQKFVQGADPGPEYSPSIAQRLRELF